MPLRKASFNLSDSFKHHCPALICIIAGIFFLQLCPYLLCAQQTELTRRPIHIIESSDDSDLLPASFHTERRQRFRELMENNSVAVFIAAPVRNRSNNINYKYHQNPDFYYYTGFRHPNALLLIFKTPQTIMGVTADEFLFIPESDEWIELWQGRLPSPLQVKASSGIEAIFYNHQFDKINLDWKAFEKIYLKTAVDINYQSSEKGSTGWLAARFKEQTDTIANRVDRVAMARLNAMLREVKTNEEIELLKKAIRLTCRGFIEALKAAKVGMNEYELQAINEYFWYHGGAEYAGFPSIVGGGHNSCILHYETNRKKLKDGDIVVMDMGAEYHGYTADITRSFPINGKFTREQKLIYDLVLKAQQAGIEACRAGNSFYEPQQRATRIIAAGLMELGIIKKESEVTRYFMHGTSHYLGLDVHDPGTYGPLKPNTVITVEPGIYIRSGSPCHPRWWNIGIRIEDDILITESEPVVLSDCVPKTTEEIEQLMAQESLINQLHEN
jgi:Xaa-Pro aminopeptidase